MSVGTDTSSKENTVAMLFKLPCSPFHSLATEIGQRDTLALEEKIKVRTLLQHFFYLKTEKNPNGYQ